MVRAGPVAPGAPSRAAETTEAPARAAVTSRQVPVAMATHSASPRRVGTSILLAQSENLS